jgi:hypothetical protein
MHPGCSSLAKYFVLVLSPALPPPPSRKGEGGAACEHRSLSLRCPVIIRRVRELRLLHLLIFLISLERVPSRDKAPRKNVTCIQVFNSMWLFQFRQSFVSYSVLRSQRDQLKTSFPALLVAIFSRLHGKSTLERSHSGKRIGYRSFKFPSIPLGTIDFQIYIFDIQTSNKKNKLL